MPANRIIAEVTAAKKMNWAILRDGELRCLGKVTDVREPPDGPGGDAFGVIETMVASYAEGTPCTVNLLPGYDAAAAEAKAIADGWSYNVELNEAETAALAAARAL